MPLMPVYARDVLAVGPMGLGVMSSAMRVGYLFGALAASPLRNIKSKGFALGWTGMLWDVAMVNFGFSRSYPLSVALLSVMGFGGWLHTVFLVTLFQTIPTEEIRGRVMGVFGLIGAGFPLGFLLGGALAVTFGFEALSKTSTLTS